MSTMFVIYVCPDAYCVRKPSLSPIDAMHVELARLV